MHRSVPVQQVWLVTLRETLVLLAFATAVAMIMASFHPKRPAWSWSRPIVAEITLTDALHFKPPLLWVDARSDEAFRKQSIPGALSLNEDHWESLLPVFMAAWQPGTRVVVFCDSQKCHASQQVALRLKRELMIENIFTLADGWSALEKDRKQ